MGSVLRSKIAPVLTVKVVGTDVLEIIEVVKFHKGMPSPFPTVYSVAQGTTVHPFKWKDMEFTSDSAYYVRVTQTGGPAHCDQEKFGAASQCDSAEGP
jgi:hypothetical protein